MNELALEIFQPPLISRMEWACLLAKEHGHKLTSARQTFAAGFCPLLLDEALKGGGGNEFENLAEHAA